MAIFSGYKTTLSYVDYWVSCYVELSLLHRAACTHLEDCSLAPKLELCRRVHVLPSVEDDEQVVLEDVVMTLLLQR